MELKHTSSLEFAEIDLLKIYNTVPRTLSRSAIAASVILDNRGRDDRVTLKQENSGNYWIFKIDSTKGWLLPKGGQRIDRYQYQTLESLFECNGYQLEGTRKFTIQEIAKVSFDFDKDKWFLEDKGILKFGNNSTFFELEAAQQECETLTLELEQSRQENKELQEKLEISKNNIQQLKRQLDLSLELQEAKNYQADISKKLESFRQELLKKISDRDSKNSNIDIETFKQEILYEISDRNNQQQNIDLDAFKQEILYEISDRIPPQPNIDLETFKQEILDEIGDHNNQQKNIDLETFKQEIIREIRDRNRNNFHNQLETVKESNLNRISISEIVEKYNKDPQSLEQIVEATVSIRVESKDNSGNSFAVNRSQGNCWIIKAGQNSSFLIPQKEYRFTSYDLRTLNSFYNYDEYIEGKTRYFELIEPARVFWTGKNWVLQAKEHKGILNFGNYSLVSLSKGSQEESKEYVAQITEKNHQIKKLEQEKTNFEEKHQILQQQFQSLQSSNQQKELTDNLNNLPSLIEIYNSNPRKLGNDIAKVMATRESLEKRRSGINFPIMFVESSQYIYLILQELPLENDCFYLVPKDNLIINSSIYQSIKEIFICQNYDNRSSNKFILSKPAIVKFTRDWENEWELVEPGEIIFS